MCKSVLVLACVASAGHRRHVQASTEQFQSSLHAASKAVDAACRWHAPAEGCRSYGRVSLRGDLTLAGVFGVLLLLFNAAVAFNPSAPGGRFSKSTAMSSSRPLVYHYPVMGPSDDSKSAVQDTSESIEEDPTDVDVLASMIRDLGPNGMCEMAKTLTRRGDMHGAEMVRREALAEFTRTLGPTHPQTIGTKNSVAELCGRQGKRAENKKLKREVLRTLMDYYGPEHRLTLRKKSQWAHVLQCRNVLYLAKAIQEDVMEGWRDQYGNEDEGYLNSKRLLAETCKRIGYLKEAEKHQLEVLEGKKQIFGRRHEQTLDAKLSYALTLKSRGVERKAWVKRFDPTDPDLLERIHELIPALREYNKLEDAEELGREVLELKLRFMLGGPFAPDEREMEDTMGHLTLKARKANLAIAAEARKKLKRAEQLLREVLSGEVRRMGPSSPQSLWVREKLEWAQVCLADLTSLESRISMYGHDDRMVVECKENLALDLLGVGQLRDAVEMFMEVYSAKLDLWLPERDHPQLLFTKARLAIALARQKKLTEALKLQREVLESWISQAGIHDPMTLIALDEVTKTIKNLGDLKGAEKLQREALMWEQRVNGPEHPLFLKRRLELAITLREQYDLEGARELLQQAVEDNERLLGPYHPLTLKSKRQLARVLNALGDAEGSAEIRFTELPKLYWCDMETMECYTQEDVDTAWYREEEESF